MDSGSRQQPGCASASILVNQEPVQTGNLIKWLRTKRLPACVSFDNDLSFNCVLVPRLECVQVCIKKRTTYDVVMNQHYCSNARGTRVWSSSYQKACQKLLYTQHVCVETRYNNLTSSRLHTGLHSLTQLRKRNFLFGAQSAASAPCRGWEAGSRGIWIGLGPRARTCLLYTSPSPRDRG